MTKMRNVGTVEVSEVLLGNDLYQRQSFTKPIWFIAKNDSWDWVGDFKQVWLEREWDRLQETGGNPFLADSDWTDEDRQDAQCEQMASDDYEASVYG